MPRRVPSDASPDARKVFEQLWDEIEKLRTQNTDLHGRRFTNVGKAIAPNDFVTKRQVEEMVADASTQVIKQVKRSAGVVVGSGTPAPSDLPAPNHAMDFGYYFVDSKYGQYEGDVKDYTNLAYIGPNNMLPAGSAQSDVKSALAVGAARLAAAGLYLVLDLERGSLLTAGGALEAVAPVWSKVKYVVVAGAWDDSKDALNAEIIADRQRIQNLGLAMKPIGCVYDGSTVPGPDWFNATELDFVVIEAYSPDAAHHGSSADNIQTISNRIAQLKAAVPANKSLGVVFQAYDRNGVFAPIVPDAVDLQVGTHKLCYNDARVAFMLLFAYGRDGGTKDHPELKAPHRSIWNAIKGLGGGGIRPTGGPPNPGDPPNPGGGAGATDCGQGRPCCGGVTGQNCPRWCSGGDFEQMFFSAQGIYIATAPPTVIDPANANHILDVSAYMTGIVDRFNTDNPLMIAIVDNLDARQIAVKKRGDPKQSEHYKVFSGGGDSAFVRYLYAATCYPARFEG